MATLLQQLKEGKEIKTSLEEGDTLLSKLRGEKKSFLEPSEEPFQPVQGPLGTPFSGELWDFGNVPDSAKLAAGGMASFIFGRPTQLAAMGVDKLEQGFLNVLKKPHPLLDKEEAEETVKKYELTPDEIVERGRGVYERIAETLTPEVESEKAHKFVETIFKPIEWVMIPGKKIIETIPGIEKSPVLKESLEIINEFATFKALHKAKGVGEKAVESWKSPEKVELFDKKYEEINEVLKEGNVEEAAIKAEEVKALVEELKEENPTTVKNLQKEKELRTAEERQEKIEKEFPREELEAKVEEKIEDVREKKEVKEPEIREEVEAPKEMVKFSSLKDPNLERDFEFFGKKEFNTFRAANKYLEGDKRVLEERADLQSVGSDLRVIKVGDKYRIAESLKATELELGRIEEIVKERDLENRKPVDVTMEEAGGALQGLQEAYKKGEISVYELREEATSMLQDAQFLNNEQVAGALDKALGVIKKEVEKVETSYEESIVPKPSEANPKIVTSKHPTTGNDVIYSSEGKPFSDPLTTSEYIETIGLKGKATVDSIRFKNPVGEDPATGKMRYEWEEGFVVDTTKKPEPSTFKPKESTVLKELAEADRIDAEFLEATKDRWYDTFKFLDNQRGEIVIPTEKLETFKKLFKEAASSGKSFREFFGDMKLGEKEIGKLEEASQKLTETIQRENLSKSDYVNLGKMERTTRQGRVFRQPLKREWLETLQEAKDIGRVAPSRFRKLTGIKQFLSEFVPTVQRFEETGKRLIKDLQNENWEAVANADAEIKLVYDKMKAVSDGMNKENFRRIGKYAHWQQKDIRARMEKSGFKEENVPVLTAKEQRLYDWMRKELERTADEVNKVRRENDLNPFKKRKDYFTMAYTEALDSTISGINKLFDAKVDPFFREANYTEKFFGSSKNRSREGLPLDVDFNAKNVFLNYMKNALEFKNQQPLISKLDEMLKPLDTGKRALTKKGEEKVVTFDLKKEKPGLYTLLRRWRNTLSGSDPDAPAHFKNLSTERSLKNAANNIAASTIGFLARTGIVQVSALRNTYALVGHSTFNGMIKALDLGNIRAARRESSFLRSALSEAELSDIFKGRSVLSRAQRVSTWHIKYSDFWTRAASYMAFKEHLIQRNNKIKKGRVKGELFEGKDLIREAERMTAKTQASGLMADIAPVQRSAIGKALTLLQTFTINDWNFLYNDIVGVKRSGLSKRRRAWRAFNYVLATTAFNILFEDAVGIESPFPSPIKNIEHMLDEGEDTTTIVKDTFLELASPIPGLFGSLKYESSIFGLGVETVDALVEAINDENWDKTIELSARLSGIPGSRQAAKVWNQYKKGEDEWSRYLLGTPPEEYFGSKKKYPSL